MWCKIPKIGSSSWASNFLDLRKRTNKKHTKNKQTKTQNTRTQCKVSTNNSSSWVNNFVDLGRKLTKKWKAETLKTFYLRQCVTSREGQKTKAARLSPPFGSGYVLLSSRAGQRWPLSDNDSHDDNRSGGLRKASSLTGRCEQTTTTFFQITISIQLDQSKGILLPGLFHYMLLGARWRTQSMVFLYTSIF